MFVSACLTRRRQGRYRIAATLNGTGHPLAGRDLENHQNKDGSVNVPTALQNHMGGKRHAGPSLTLRRAAVSNLTAQPNSQLPGVFNTMTQRSRKLAIITVKFSSIRHWFITALPNMVD